MVKLNKKTKHEFFNKLPTDNDKPFWKICKPYFSNKNPKYSSNIILTENKEIYLKEKDVAHTFNEYFGTIVQSFDLYKWPEIKQSSGNDNVIVNIINKYKHHPSITKIKQNFVIINSFSFKTVTLKEVHEIILKLDDSKATGGEIPLKLIKDNEILCYHLCKWVNEILRSGIFPDTQKLAIITPILKKGDALKKENYRPISVLPVISKNFEKVIFSQISEYIDKYLNPILCGFRKGHSTAHALFKLIQSWQKELDKSGYIATILMDLSKAYDCISHDLIIAKLEAYGFDCISLKLMYNYLTNRKHRVKIGSEMSEWFNILLGVPQGSILGPLIFNIFINDLFLFITNTEICNFADDNTLFKCSPNLSILFKALEKDTQIILNWFKNNSLTLFGPGGGGGGGRIPAMQAYFFRFL